RYAILERSHHHEQIDRRREAGKNFAAVQHVKFAIAPGFGRKVTPIAAGLGFADSAADDLASAPDHLEEQRLIPRVVRALDHAADAEQMHVDRERGGAVALRELLLA